jgi:hypothetical protein
VYTDVETALLSAAGGAEGGGGGEGRVGVKSLVRLGTTTHLFAAGSSGKLAEKVIRNFQTRGTHVIVAGGRGQENSLLALSEVLLRKGAARIVLVSCMSETHNAGERNDDGDDDDGGRISRVTCDVSSRAACDHMVASLDSMEGGVVGLWHCGLGALGNSGGDGVHSPGEEEEGVLAGLRNLDQGSRLLAPCLEHFVVWSACLEARAGEGEGDGDCLPSVGYQWAVETLCQQRKGAHLPAKVVQVSRQPGGGGCAAEILDSLDEIMNCENTVVSVV